MFALRMAPALVRGAVGLRRIVLALACGFAAPALAAAAEEAMVVSSTAPSHITGAILAPAEQLNVPPGASLTLLFRSGQMLRLRGPVDGSLDQTAAEASSEAVSALAQAFRLRGVEASV